MWVNSTFAAYSLKTAVKIKQGVFNYCSTCTNTFYQPLVLVLGYRKWQTKL